MHRRQCNYGICQTTIPNYIEKHKVIASTNNLHHALKTLNLSFRVLLDHKWHHIMLEEGST